MAITTIDARMLQKMFLAGAKNLETNKEWINELNVFPVPDGDTGTNMILTILSAAEEAGAIENPTMADLAKAISSGSLRGARGNSGVILSQLFRGFTKEIANYDVIDSLVLAAAFFFFHCIIPSVLPLYSLYTHRGYMSRENFVRLTVYKTAVRC